MKYVLGVILGLGAFLVALLDRSQRKAQKAELRAVTAENKAQDTQDQAEVQSAIDKATTLEDKARSELAALNDPSLPKL